MKYLKKEMYWAIMVVMTTFFYACETAKVAQKPTVIISDNLIVNLIDTIDVTTLRMDTTGDGIFGRKIIYRDMTAAKAATAVSGNIKIKVCINREGIVKYAEVLKDSSTIKEVKALKSFLKASRGYKFQPNPDAPDYECGKMSFRIDYRMHKVKRN